MIINEPARCPTRSDNIYFANNEQVSLAVIMVVLCFTHAEHNLIKLKRYTNADLKISLFVLIDIKIIP